ncbi:hypothetical protein [Xanthobacter autotrophicus]|uniref:hypothetical protein n=1 Tax=Xanthobacter autotrophicus TaxID=280 RepID=UPI00372BE8B3
MRYRPNTFIGGARIGAPATLPVINPSGGRVIGEIARGGSAEIGKAESVDKAVKEVLERAGQLHIVVNNAGVTHRNQPLLDV